MRFTLTGKTDQVDAILVGSLSIPTDQVGEVAALAAKQLAKLVHVVNPPEIRGEKLELPIVEKAVIAYKPFIIELVLVTLVRLLGRNQLEFRRRLAN